MEDRDLINRFTELSYRADKSGDTFYSSFLDLHSQDVLFSLDLPVTPVLYGGYDEAERCVAVFGEDEPPVRCVMIEPSDMKFAEKLTHRDFLGALLSLGIKREAVGDVAVFENRAYVFCLDSVSELIVDELENVKHTKVKRRFSSLPNEAVSKPVPSSAVAPSLRLDAVICAVFDLSRSDGKELFEKEKVFIRGKVCTDPVKEPKINDVISVRGHGKFIFDGQERITGKGKIRFAYRIYK